MPQETTCILSSAKQLVPFNLYPFLTDPNWAVRAGDLLLRAAGLYCAPLPAYTNPGIRHTVDGQITNRRNFLDTDVSRLPPDFNVV